MKNIKWLIAHEPEHLFLRTAKAFAKLLEEATKDIKIEILTTEQYQAKYNKEFTRDMIPSAVTNNDIQMSQTEVWELGRICNRNDEHDWNFFVFDMPWLFESHAHARRVLEGPIGQSMNKRLKAKSGMRGLAYTYSGGYRTIGSNRAIKNLNDLAEQTLRVNGNPITQQYWKNLGVNITRERLAHAGNEPVMPAGVDGKDTTYIRFPQAKNWLKSEHSLFLTNILISEKFWNTLTESEQEIMQKTAIEAARLERKWSQEDADKFEATAQERGCTITELSAEDKREMKAKAEPIYAEWSKKFMPGLINGIKRYN